MKRQNRRIGTDQERAFSRWSCVRGNWTVQDDVEITNVDTKVIYRSPEEPSHVAWAGLWKEADGAVK